MILFFFKSKFSPLLIGFRKNHSKQNALLNMIEKWKHALDKSKRFVLYLGIYLKRFIHLISIYYFPFHFDSRSPFYSTLITFPILYKTLTFATLPMKIQLYSIENNFKEVKTILKMNFELLQCVFMRITWS